MRFVLSVAIILVLITSCQKNSKPKSVVGQVFNFVETTDKNFCNPDSIVLSDCAGGDFYFTPNGNVLNTFFCIGDDSTSYLIGKYSVTDNLISCVFNKEYSFYVPQYKGDSSDQAERDPNSGRMRNIEPINFELQKLKCDKFEYSFLSRSNAEEKYVLRISEDDYSKGYLAGFKKIKAFRRM